MSPWHVGIFSAFVAMSSCSSAANAAGPPGTSDSVDTCPTEKGCSFRPPGLQARIEELAEWRGELEGFQLLPTDNPEPGSRPFQLLHDPRRRVVGYEAAGIHLEGMDLQSVDLSRTIMISARLCNASLKDADLQGSILSFANLTGAKLDGATLSKAYLYEAILVEVELIETDLAGARFISADMSGAIFEPQSGLTLNVRDIAGAKHLAMMTYRTSPVALIELRKAFKDGGYREQERQITLALERRSREMACAAKGVRWIECIARLMLFEWPSGYGLYPARPLWIIVALWIALSLVYGVPLSRRHGAGIFRVWNPQRIDTRDGEEIPTRMRLAGWGWLNAPYFSLLSTFYFGWREVNVGSWISRIQPREYVLAATGWVRTVSGIQSILCVYFLALWVLTYFGRPFE
jgi:pentapeptide repeat protein